MPGGIVMAHPLALVAGMLMFSGVQASDTADGSKNNGFLSKFMPLRSGSSKGSIGDNGKFMVQHLHHMEIEGQSEASSDHRDVAEEALSTPTVDSRTTHPPSDATLNSITRPIRACGVAAGGATGTPLPKRCAVMPKMVTIW